MVANNGAVEDTGAKAATMRIELEATPTPISAVTRGTPAAITDMLNKDAGDPAGDLSFFLSRHNLRQMCAADPHAHGNGCFLAGQDVIVQYEVHVDGRWGPCKPKADILASSESRS